MCSNLRFSFCPENAYLCNSSWIHLNWFFVKLDFSESSHLPSCLLKMKYASHYINPSLKVILVSVQFSCSVMSNSLRPHGLQIPGFPVLHKFPKPAQTHVHLFGDAIQPFHPLSSPSPPAFNLFQHQGIF